MLSTLSYIDCAAWSALLILSIPRIGSAFGFIVSVMSWVMVILSLIKAIKLASLYDLCERRDICENKHGGNAQSAAAHQSILHCKENSREQIWQLIKARGSAGATLHEIAAELGVHPHQISGRISELKSKGRLRDSGLRRTTPSGRKAAVLIACV